ncbi:MAG: segregation/condensation protein A [Deltaproteobacteria bacterium]|nr:segregation/condensation protein A [Deltaproteobacteria bacterium]
MSELPRAAGEIDAPKPLSKEKEPARDQPVIPDRGIHELRIELPAFEGPLDLLLHLCQKHEISIVELPVAFVTERYLAYLDLMRALDLDIASEYLVMAATLVHIKSRLLLPPDPTQDDEAGAFESEEDLRAALIRKLLEYQKYKEAGEALAERGVVGRDVFLRGAPDETVAGPAPLAEVSLFKLLDALSKVLERARVEVAREIIEERVGLAERMVELTELLATRGRVRFDELFDDARTLSDVVVTFLAILEMAKRRLARLYQPSQDDVIFIEAQRAPVDATPAEDVGASTEAATTARDAVPTPDGAEPIEAGETPEPSDG